MLILTRRLDEAVVIEVEGQAEPIEIKITELTAGQARLGITAPPGCKIWRKELHQTVQLNRQAATGDPDASSLRDFATRLHGQGKDETSE